MENFLTVKQLAARCPALTEGGLRHLLFHNIDDFRTLCSCKIGSKVLIDINAVEVWLENHRGDEDHRRFRGEV